MLKHVAKRALEWYNPNPGQKNSFVRAMFTRTRLRQNNPLNMTANYLANLGNVRHIHKGGALKWQRKVGWYNPEEPVQHTAYVKTARPAPPKLNPRS